MRKNIIFSAKRELLLAAVIFVSAAAIVTGTILSTGTMTTTTTSTTASAATEEQEEQKSKTTTKQKTSTTNNANETVPNSSTSLPLPTPSTTTSLKKSNNNDLVTTQGTLSSESALASTDIVNSVSTTYEVLFTAATTATIAKVLVTFPSGFGVSGAKGLEVSGIGSSNSISSVSTSGQTITFNIQSPTSISAGVKLRIEVRNIKNTGTAASNYQVSVTTKRSDGTTIDGPTSSSAFSIRKIGSATISDNSISTSMIKDQAVTGSKIAGTSKLFFVKCSASASGIVAPGAAIQATCSFSSASSGDSVVATITTSGTPCFELANAVGSSGVLFFGFRNECSTDQTFESINVSAIVFKPT